MLADDNYLDIKPASFEVEQRREAVGQALELGKGVRMEIGNTWTHYYATSSVPVGRIEVWMSRTYSGMQEHATTLRSPDEPFDAWNFKWPPVISDRMKAAILRAAEGTQKAAREQHADNPDVLRQIDKMTTMLYELELREYQMGFHGPMLAVAFQEALEAVQEQINENVPITAETVLRVENPYA